MMVIWFRGLNNLVDWINDLARQRNHASAESQRKLDILAWSRVKTPLMTAALIEQIGKDAEAAALALGIKVTVHVDASKLQVIHSTFPTFSLQIDVPARGLMVLDPVVTCLISSRKNLTFNRREKTVAVGVKCVGQDECYFVIKDNDQASVEQASQSLLQPLFSEVAGA